jgi:hypothetical protein
LRGEIKSIGGNSSFIFAKIGFSIVTFIIFHWKHIYQIFRKSIFFSFCSEFLPSFSLSITSPSSLSSVLLPHLSEFGLILVCSPSNTATEKSCRGSEVLIVIVRPSCAAATKTPRWSLFLATFSRDVPVFTTVMTLFVRRWLDIILNRYRLTFNENPPRDVYM